MSTNALTLNTRSAQVSLAPRSLSLAMKARSLSLLLPSRSVGQTLAARSSNLTLPTRTGVQNSYLAKVTAIPGLLAYYPLNELSGTVCTDVSGNGRHGTYHGVTLGQTGIGDGLTCAQFDGTAGYVDIYSASLANAWLPTNYTISCWCKVQSAAVWTDGVVRNALTLGADANNRAEHYRGPVNNNIGALLDKTGHFSFTNYTTGAPTGWFHLLSIFTIAGPNAWLMYLNGVQVGSATNAFAWSGALSATRCLIGAQVNTPSALWKGYIGHVGIWARTLTTEIAALNTIP